MPISPGSVPPSPPANVTRGRSSSGYNTPNFHHRGAPSLSTPPTHTEFAPAYGGFSNGSSGLYPPASPMVRGSDSVDSAFRMPWSPAASPATRSPIGRSPATVLRQQSSSGRNGGGGGFTDSGGSPTVGFGGRHRRAPSAGDISRCVCSCHCLTSTSLCYVERNGGLRTITVVRIRPRERRYIVCSFVPHRCWFIMRTRSHPR